MRILLLFPAFLLVLIMACGKKAGGERLSADKMEDILWDLSRADELVNMRFIRDSTLNKKQESIRLYEAVFALHKTSQAQFKTSLNWYHENPDQLKTVFDSLNVRQQRSMSEVYGDTSQKQTAPLQSQSAVPDTGYPRYPAAQSQQMSDSMKRVADSIRNYYQQHYQGKKKTILQGAPQ